MVFAGTVPQCSRMCHSYAPINSHAAFVIHGEELLRHEVLLAVFGMFAVGVADLLRRRGVMSGGSPVTYMAIESGFITLFSFIALLVLEGKPVVTGAIITFSPASGFLIFAGILALMFALSTGEASRLVPITRMGFVVTFLLATFVLGESLSLSKGIGVVLAATAIVLLSLDL